VSRITIEPSNCVIGATVYDVSMAEIPNDELINTIEVALEKYGVLIFPDQFITPQQQVDWSRAFAELELTDLEEARLTGVEEIFVVGNIGKSIVAFSPKDEGGDLEWHTDHIQQETPARASLLRALEAPDEGGDTLFACMYSAYDSLSDDEKQSYCQLEVINHISGLEYYLKEQKLTSEPESRPDAVKEGVVRPLVREHPVTGLRSLYFGSKISVGIVGWSDEQSRNFIDSLTQHACQEAFQYRHHWRAGDAVLWDNRRVLHAGTAYDTKNTRRHMHRTTWREDQEIRLISVRYA